MRSWSDALTSTGYSESQVLTMMSMKWAGTDIISAHVFMVEQPRTDAGRRYTVVVLQYTIKGEADRPGTHRDFDDIDAAMRYLLVESGWYLFTTR